MSKVKFKTTMGDFVVQLNTEKAPITSENFLKYVKDKYYDGTIFHRIIDNFMVQGGGFDKDMNEKCPTYPPIRNEAHNGILNKRGTVAMARTYIIDSATAQFFVNVSDNYFLDHKDTSDEGYGYAVFGKVIEGMDVIDAMKIVKTSTKGFHDDVPIKPIIINSAEIIK